MMYLQRILFLWLVLIVSSQVYAQDKASRKIQHKKPPSILDTPAEFSGWQGETKNPADFSEIRIGYFAPHSSENSLAESMVNGAILAVEEANDDGGFDGIPFQLVKRWANDTWGAASKEMVKLVYRDQVWAVVGSIDGAATHIAEQVATKSRVPLLSPVSSDPTLTYINIPWMFRLPPDDKQQAEVIVQRGVRALSLNKVGLITSTDHDGRIFSEEIIARLNAEQIKINFHLQIPSKQMKFEEIFERVSLFNPPGIILRLEWHDTLTLLGFFRDNQITVPIILPWIPGLVEEDLVKSYEGKMYFVEPFSKKENQTFGIFASHYKKRFGKEPTPSAAYTYDAVQLLIQSLKKSGLNRSLLRDQVANWGDFQGVTGNISWDNGGGNEGQPVLRIVQ